MPPRTARCCPMVLALYLVLPSPAAGQEPAPSLRGAVVSAETGDRIPFALVVLEPRYSQRFTDERGSFAFLTVDPGSYRLLVRQVGFRPFDSTLTVGASTPPLRIELHRIAVELRPIVVAAQTRCVTPVAADAATNPELAAIVEQLKLNAQRQALLLDRYPFTYQVVRVLTEHLRYGEDRSFTDTLALRSDARWPYAPGRVVTDSRDVQFAGSRDVHLPVLADFADSLFQAWHCFSLGGLDSLEGREFVRLDFQAAEGLRDPDVNGSAYLDPRSYQVVHTRVELTLLSRAARGVTAWTATATFREIMPNVAVTERMTAVTTLQPGRSRVSVVGRHEMQRLARIAFVRAPPTAPDISP